MTAATTVMDGLWREEESLPLSDAIFNDIEAVLDEDALPDSDDFRALASRLHLALRLLLGITNPSATLAPSTHRLLFERLPLDGATALGYLRRLATAVLDLADQYLADVAAPGEPDRRGP